MHLLVLDKQRSAKINGIERVSGPLRLNWEKPRLLVKQGTIKGYSKL